MSKSNIIVLDNEENFIDYLNPDLLDLTETFKDGLRSIEVVYDVEEITDADKYFTSGHKIFVTGDGNLTPCLYVLNSKVKRDLYVENKYSFSAEEVLVELNYAPLTSQNEITATNGFTTSKGEVKVDYKALYYWFNNYFNIGIVQDCISSYASKIKFTGTMNLMSLLRYIEEETGNVFVTRYEKDLLTNTIHRYLDFLNQTNENKNWELHFDYDFVEQEPNQVLDENGNLVDGEIIPLTPNVDHDIDPEDLQFRITYNGNIMNTDGGVYDEDDPEQTPLVWEASDLGLTSETDHVVISMKYTTSDLAVKIHEKTFQVSTDPDDCGVTDVSTITNTYADEDYLHSVSLLNGSYFEFYDTSLNKVIFHRRIDSILSTVREDVLNIGQNIANVEYEEDESDTYYAMAPILSLDKDTNKSNSLSYEDMATVVKDWKNLSVNKNTVIPMIIEKVQITGTDDHPCVQRRGTPSDPNARSAEQLLGTYNLSSNYWKMPLVRNDNLESENRTYEYWVATAYWTPPFTKLKNELYVSVDSGDNLNYPNIRGRLDSRDNRAAQNTPKTGTISTSEENPYAIYNAVAMALKDKKDPKFNITVDVANLETNKYNDYNVHDKVYVKLPGFEGLVTARVSSTVKDLHNISENKITLENYSVNTTNVLTPTYIDASNINFKYPNSKKLTVTLKDSTDDTAKLKNKLVTFTLYKLDDNGSSTFTRKVYSKKTNNNGQASITLKYNPGQYEMEIQFGGDAEYSESSITIEISVGGVKKVSTTTNKTTPSSTSKSKTETKTVTQYYDKYGRSPDKKTLMAVGLPSRGSETRKYGYRFMKATFKNHCPACHRDGTLYWGWNYGTYFRGRNEYMGSKEGHFFCDKCDADFSGINGENHVKSGKPKLTRLTKPVKSSRAEAQKLVNGKMEYGTTTKTVTQKKNTSNASRTIIGSPSQALQKIALSIVGDKVGFQALKAICAYMDKNVRYVGYPNFHRKPTVVLKRGGNCCDQTRCFLELCDCAGLSDYYTMYYVHVNDKKGHIYAQLKSKATNNTVYIDCASDHYGCYGYVCRGYSHGSPSSTYPSLPPGF